MLRQQRPYPRKNFTMLEKSSPPPPLLTSN
jgi:hypothetical protein